MPVIKKSITIIFGYIYIYIYDSKTLVTRATA